MLSSKFKSFSFSVDPALLFLCRSQKLTDLASQLSESKYGPLKTLEMALDLHERFAKNDRKSPEGLLSTINRLAAHLSNYKYLSWKTVMPLHQL